MRTRRVAGELLFLLLLLMVCATAFRPGPEPAAPEPEVPSGEKNAVEGPGSYTIAGIAPGMTESEVLARQGPVRSSSGSVDLRLWEFDRCQVYFRSGRVLAVRGHDAYRGATRLGSELATTRQETIQRMGREPVATYSSPYAGQTSLGCPGPFTTRDVFLIAEGWLLVVDSHLGQDDPEFTREFWLFPEELRDSGFFFSQASCEVHQA